MKNIKTFIISKFQIQALRNLMIANGISEEEVAKLSGADLALRWKACNIDIIGSKTQKEAFMKQYPFLVGYDLQAQVAPPKETKKDATPSTETPEVVEMTAPETTSKKGKKSKAEKTEA